MAAHCIRILSELVHRSITEETRAQFLHALDYAPGMDELDPEQYHELQNALESGYEDEVMRCATLILADRIGVWRDLGFPDTHEDWSNRAIAGRTVGW